MWIACKMSQFFCSQINFHQSWPKSSRNISTPIVLKAFLRWCLMPIFNGVWCPFSMVFDAHFLWCLMHFHKRKKSVHLCTVSLRGVVVDLSGLRDRSPGFKTRSRPLTFMKADTNFRTLHVVGFSCTNEFYQIPSCKRR